MNIYMLIDQSGSMRQNWEETMGAVNGFISDLDGKPGFKRAKVNIAAFDSGGPLRFTEVRRHVSMSKWIPIVRDEIQPRGMTPLYDAIGRLDGWVVEDAPKKAIIVIITDGHENASREHTKTTAKMLLDSYTKKGFDVSFIGADFDAFGEAMKVGISIGNTLNMSPGNFRGATGVLAAKSMFYGKTGNTRAYTEAERAAAGEKQ